VTGVAVVVPCFNLGRTIEEAVESALEQTRAVEEIVVIDDGSTDLFTRQVLERMDLPRTRIVRTPNRGLAAARNEGLRLSTAPYVVFLDGDDLLDASYVEKMAGRLDADPLIDFVSCAMQAFEGASYVWAPSCDLVEGLVKGSIHASTLFRRHVFAILGGFDSQLPAFEASEVGISAVEHGFRGEVLSDPLLKYRVRRGSKYHEAVAPERYLKAREAVLRKHAAIVNGRMVDVLTTTEAFLVEVEAHHRYLSSRRAGLQHELHALMEEQTALERALAERSADRIDWGDLRSPQPVGTEASEAMPRYYIGKFLSAWRSDLRGCVLEDGGGWAEWLAEHSPDGVDLLNTHEKDAPELPAETYDCVLVTRARSSADGLRAMLRSAVRALKPGGVLFCTLPSVAPFLSQDGGTEEWRFTECSARILFAEHFPLGAFEVCSYGNVMVCAAALHNLAPEDLEPHILNSVDPSFPLVICVRAVKPPPTQSSRLRHSVSNEKRGEAGAGAILMYHRIASLDPDTHHLCVSPARFRAHMEYLRREYEPIGLEDLVRATAAGRISERSVAVTLDDGYLDALHTASPILLEFEIPATFFINSDRLDEKHERWWDVVEHVFLAGLKIPAALTLQTVGQRAEFPTGTPEERARTARALNDAAWSMTNEQRQAMVREIVAWSGLDIVPRESHRVMTGREILQLSQRPGHSIGAHTIHHLALTMHGPATQRSEILDDKTQLERLLGRPVLTFSYPYGDFSAEMVELARAAPFVGAVTVQNGLARRRADPMLLPRIEIRECDAGAFARQLAQAFAGGP
jgi:peptidoglycan/xylan/chitin deacetylase (PgdA/CDA1 family)